MLKGQQWASSLRESTHSLPLPFCIVDTWFEPGPTRVHKPAAISIQTSIQQLQVGPLENKKWVHSLSVVAPKADGGVRKLGIPSIRDRVVQQALLEILQPIFDPTFHPSSYGYRPGRSAHQAIAKATLFIREYNLRHVVDMDLSKCFDTLNHE